MNATFYCPSCGRQMAIAPEHLGLTVACPHCQSPVQTPAVGGLPPPRQAAPNINGVGPPVPYGYGVYSSRSKVVAGVLGILLGWLGLHRFYLGYAGIGILQIIVTVATCGGGWLWGFVEGIVCLAGGMTDVDGRPLRD